MAEISPEELRKAQDEFEQADSSRESKREQRNRLVREARRQGWSLQQIRDHTGLTRGRIGQIINESNGR